MPSYDAHVAGAEENVQRLGAAMDDAEEVSMMITMDARASDLDGGGQIRARGRVVFALAAARRSRALEGRRGERAGASRVSDAGSLSRVWRASACARAALESSRAFKSGAFYAKVFHPSPGFNI